MRAPRVGLDDAIEQLRLRQEDLGALIRTEITPPQIHLVDLERTEYVGKTVQTDLLVAGVGETFHVPKAWQVLCDTGEGENKCDNPSVNLGSSAALLELCRMSRSQLIGFMRHAGRCPHRSVVKVTAHATVTELLALPAANAIDATARDYREKIVALVGTLTNSNIRYRATGEVIAGPKRQRASLLITGRDRLQSAAEGFALTSEVREAFGVFQVPDAATVDDAEGHAWRIASTATQTITKVFGVHRIAVLLAELIVFHSLREIPWEGEPLKGTVDLMVIGDTGQGKSTQYRRLSAALGLGYFISGSTSSRTGVLYTMDSKVNDKRVLRWGAFPLAHGELLGIDEAQNIAREQWAEFTTARSEGVLKVDRAIRAEHPSRTRLICFANPLGHSSMAEFQYGIQAVHPSQGCLSAQDLRRFDLVACVSEGDQTMEDIRRGVPPGDVVPIPAEALRVSVLWAWTRTAQDVCYAEETVPAILSLAADLQKSFGTSEIPLVITDTHEKVARLAVGFAALLHSTDVSHEKVVVAPVHVALAGRLIAAFYQHPNCAFDEYAKVLRRRAGLAEGEYTEITAALLTPGSNREDSLVTEALLELFVTEDDIPRADLEAASGLGREALNNRLGKLRQHRLVQSGRKGYRKTPRFIAFLRQWLLTRPNTPNPPIKPPEGGVSR
jgi:MCM P-loop domain